MSKKGICECFLKLGKSGQRNTIIGKQFRPSDLAPLLLLDADENATADKWETNSAEWPSGYQTIASDQPLVSGGAVQFDGVSDYMFGAYFNYGTITT